jgi:hypothetical protein
MGILNSAKVNLPHVAEVVGIIFATSSILYNSEKYYGTICKLQIYK